MEHNVRYAPPPLAVNWLNQQLRKRYPTHPTDLLVMLVEEYAKFWRLLRTYPNKGIVAPGPIVVVQIAHQSNREMYREDCLSYLKYYLGNERRWHGPESDPRRAFVTVRHYQLLFDEIPPKPWGDMTRLMGIGLPNHDGLIYM